jgi:hypothetical protein
MDWLEAEEAAEAAEASKNSEPEFVTIHGDDNGPLDRLAETAEWEDILVYGAQWETAKPQDRETLKAFKRPGGTYDISAKVLKANPHVLVVHSDAAGLPSGKGQKLTKGRVYAHLHYGGDQSAAAKALVRGEAVNLPAHVIDAVRSRDNIAGIVTEVAANHIKGDSSEENSGGRWVSLDQFLDGTYTPHSPTSALYATTVSNSSTAGCGTPTSRSPQPGKPHSRYGKSKRSSSGVATSSISTSKKPTRTASSIDSKGSASTPKR